MIENLKRDSVVVSFVFYPLLSFFSFSFSFSFLFIYLFFCYFLFIFFLKKLDDYFQAVQGIFKAGSRFIETERLLNDFLIENDRLHEVEKTASARIQEVENQHKTVEEGLQTAECQLAEISAKLERECNRSNGFQMEINKLRVELAEARTAAQNIENAAQAFYE